MAATIDYFEITGLHGHRRLHIPIEDNKIILVGENGTGKTTVLRLLYYYLSGQWNALRRHDFTSLAVSVGGKRIELTRDQLGTAGEPLGARAFGDLPPGLLRHLRNLTFHGDSALGMAELGNISERYGIPADVLLERLAPVVEPSPKARKELDRVRSHIREALLPERGRCWALLVVLVPDML